MRISLTPSPTRFHIVGIAQFHAADPSDNPQPCIGITKLIKPLGEKGGLADFDHA